MGQGADEMTERSETTFDRDSDYESVNSDLDAYPVSGTDDAADDPEVEALVVDIETTRSQMSQTVDELGDRLAPSAVADRAGNAVREATVGKIEAKVNDMTTAASDLVSNAGQTAQEAGGGIVETIRRNPVPAVMAGVGLGWLWMNRSQTSGTTWSSGRRSYQSGWMAGDDGWRRTDGGASWAGRGGSTGSGGIGQKIGDRAQEASSAVGDAADSARRAAGNAVDDLGMNASRAAETVGMTASDAMAQAQQAVESNPLAFGALAVAVGTAIGLALPATQAEKRVMGNTGSRLIDQVETAVSEPLDEMAKSQSTQ
jgi:ElaB/YqjD/DUF883 family membrane-anchored ribosome-binding protein